MKAMSVVIAATKKQTIRVVMRTDTKAEVSVCCNQHRWNECLQKQSIIPVAVVNENIKANETKETSVKEDATLVNRLSDMNTRAGHLYKHTRKQESVRR